MGTKVNIKGQVRDLYSVDREEIFKLILSGEISEKEFEDWLDELISTSRDDSYNSGYDNGYDSGYESGKGSCDDA